ncbi:MAG: cupredoxin domain-containing protein [Rhodobacteraceae bacterium]|nr:cupredoxin domain-containing protein [Paracoccaceae bacterium]
MKLCSKTILATTFVGLIASPVLAGGTHGDGHGDGMAIGKPGKSAEADRVVEIIMTDNEFSIPEMTVKTGETVRFVVVNEGEFLHEFNIGTQKMHANHQTEMMEMMEKGMMDGMRMMGQKGHDDPNSILLQPGESGEITWTFGGPADIEFACNVPGHYESGMVGPLSIRPSATDNS